MSELDRLVAVAEGRGGYATGSEAAKLGVDAMTLARACRAGLFHRLRRNAYVVGEQWTQAGPDERECLRVRAILLGRPGSVASHGSALLLHGLPLWPLPQRVDVLAPVQRVWVTQQLRVAPMRGVIPSVDLDGTPAVIVVDALQQYCGEGRVSRAVVPLDAALHRGLVSADGLYVGLNEVDRVVLRRVARVSDAKSESVGESRLRLIVMDLGYNVRSQVEVHGLSRELVGRVDLLVGESVILEFDGAIKYEGADGRQALVAEKAREDALRSLGYVVIRVTWADLEHPRLLGERIRAALRLCA